MWPPRQPSPNPSCGVDFKTTQSSYFRRLHVRTEKKCDVIRLRLNTTNLTEGSGIACSEDHIAVQWEGRTADTLSLFHSAYFDPSAKIANAGDGDEGAVGDRDDDDDDAASLLPPPQNGGVRVHTVTRNLADWQFSPFRTPTATLLGTVGEAEESNFKIWRVPHEQSEGVIALPVVSFSGHRRKASTLAFHPLCMDICATGGGDRCLKIWNLQKTERPSTPDATAIAVRTAKPTATNSPGGGGTSSRDAENGRLACVELEGNVTSTSWKSSGGYMLAATSRDSHNWLSLVDTRQSAIVAKVASHSGGRHSRCAFLDGQAGHDRLVLTTGFRNGKPEFRLWDIAQLREHVDSGALTDGLSSPPQIYWDESSGLALIGGRGCSVLRAHHLDTQKAKLVSIKDMPLCFGQERLRGFSLLPKRVVDTSASEILSGVCMVGSNALRRAAFVIERKPGYHPDLYKNDCVAGVPVMSLDQWVAGSCTSAVPVRVPLGPEALQVPRNTAAASSRVGCLTRGTASRRHRSANIPSTSSTAARSNACGGPSDSPSEAPPSQSRLDFAALRETVARVLATPPPSRAASTMADGGSRTVDVGTEAAQWLDFEGDVSVKASDVAAGQTDNSMADEAAGIYARPEDSMKNVAAKIDTGTDSIELEYLPHTAFPCAAEENSKTVVDAPLIVEGVNPSTDISETAESSTESTADTHHPLVAINAPVHFIPAHSLTIKAEGIPTAHSQSNATLALQTTLSSSEVTPLTTTASALQSLLENRAVSNDSCIEEDRKENESMKSPSERGAWLLVEGCEKDTTVADLESSSIENEWTGGDASALATVTPSDDSGAKRNHSDIISAAAADDVVPLASTADDVADDDSLVNVVVVPESELVIASSSSSVESIKVDGHHDCYLTFDAEGQSEMAANDDMDSLLEQKGAACEKQTTTTENQRLRTEQSSETASSPPRAKCFTPPAHSSRPMAKSNNLSPETLYLPSPPPSPVEMSETVTFEVPTGSRGSSNRRNESFQWLPLDMASAVARFSFELLFPFKDTTSQNSSDTMKMAVATSETSHNSPLQKKCSASTSFCAAKDSSSVFADPGNNVPATWQKQNDTAERSSPPRPPLNLSLTMLPLQNPDCGMDDAGMLTRRRLGRVSALSVQITPNGNEVEMAALERELVSPRLTATSVRPRQRVSRRSTLCTLSGTSVASSSLQSSPFNSSRLSVLRGSTKRDASERRKRPDSAASCASATSLRRVARPSAWQPSPVAGTSAAPLRVFSSQSSASTESFAKEPVSYGEMRDVGARGRAIAAPKPARSPALQSSSRIKRPAAPNDDWERTSFSKTEGGQRMREGLVTWDDGASETVVHFLDQNSLSILHSYPTPRCTTVSPNGAISSSDSSGTLHSSGTAMVEVVSRYRLINTHERSIPEMTPPEPLGLSPCVLRRPTDCGEVRGAVSERQARRPIALDECKSFATSRRANQTQHFATRLGLSRDRGSTDRQSADNKSSRGVRQLEPLQLSRSCNGGGVKRELRGGLHLPRSVGGLSDLQTRNRVSHLDTF